MVLFWWTMPYIQRRLVHFHPTLLSFCSILMEVRVYTEIISLLVINYFVIKILQLLTGRVVMYDPVIISRLQTLMTHHPQFIHRILLHASCKIFSCSFCLLLLFFSPFFLPLIAVSIWWIDFSIYLNINIQTSFFLIHKELGGFF